MSLIDDFVYFNDGRYQNLHPLIKLGGVVVQNRHSLGVESTSIPRERNLSRLFEPYGAARSTRVRQISTGCLPLQAPSVATSADSPNIGLLNVASNLAQSVGSFLRRSLSRLSLGVMTSTLSPDNRLDDHSVQIQDQLEMPWSVSRPLVGQAVTASLRSSNIQETRTTDKISPSTSIGASHISRGCNQQACSEQATGYSVCKKDSIKQSNRELTMTSPREVSSLSLSRRSLLVKSPGGLVINKIETFDEPTIFFTGLAKLRERCDQTDGTSGVRLEGAHNAFTGVGTRRRIASSTSDAILSTFCIRNNSGIGLGLESSTFRLSHQLRDSSFQTGIRTSSPSVNANVDVPMNIGINDGRCQSSCKHSDADIPLSFCQSPVNATELQAHVDVKEADEPKQTQKGHILCLPEPNLCTAKSEVQSHLASHVDSLFKIEDNNQFITSPITVDHSSLHVKANALAHNDVQLYGKRENKGEDFIEHNGMCDYHANEPQVSCQLPETRCTLSDDKLLELTRFSMTQKWLDDMCTTEDLEICDKSVNLDVNECWDQSRISRTSQQFRESETSSNTDNSNEDLDLQKYVQ